jgi:small subunit ribosomal protein S20
LSQDTKRIGEYVPNSKSALKRLRQNDKRRVHNKAARSRLRTALKKVRDASDAGQAAEAYREASRLLDRAAARGLIHKNVASRSKGRLATHVRKLGG